MPEIAPAQRQHAKVLIRLAQVNWHADERAKHSPAPATPLPESRTEADYILDALVAAGWTPPGEGGAANG